MKPPWAKPVSLDALVKNCSHSAPRPAFLALLGTARSEPPRKPGVGEPAVVPGMAKVDRSAVSAGLPPLATGASTEPISQPLPMMDEAWPLAMIESWSLPASLVPPTEKSDCRVCQVVTPETKPGLVRVPVQVLPSVLLAMTPEVEPAPPT